jgi:nitrite reductase/ring-hydroxylating ferredoxin subunit
LKKIFPVFRSSNAGGFIHRSRVVAGIAILLSFIFACKKSTDQIPPASVDFNLYLTQPDFQTLNTVGNYVYVTGGVKGIIVYHKSIDEFAAFERTCPYDPNTAAAKVVVDSSGLGMIDYNCGSRYNILDGSVTHGPASYPLRQYACEYDGVSSLHIHN